MVVHKWSKTTFGFFAVSSSSILLRWRVGWVFFHWIPFCMRRVDKQGVKTICIASNNCLASGIKQETSKQGQLRQEKQVGQYYYSRRSSLHATYTRPTFFLFEWCHPTIIPSFFPSLLLLLFLRIRSYENGTKMVPMMPRVPNPRRALPRCGQLFPAIL